MLLLDIIVIYSDNILLLLIFFNYSLRRAFDYDEKYINK